MSFPDKPYGSIKTFLRDYTGRYATAQESVSETALVRTLRKYWWRPKPAGIPSMPAATVVWRRSPTIFTAITPKVSVPTRP